jgi:hypothetical protein
MYKIRFLVQRKGKRIKDRTFYLFYAFLELTSLKGGGRLNLFYLESFGRQKKCHLYLFVACDDEKVLPLLTQSFVWLEKRVKMIALGLLCLGYGEIKGGREFLVCSRVFIGLWGKRGKVLVRVEEGWYWERTSTRGKVGSFGILGFLLVLVKMRGLYFGQGKGEVFQFEGRGWGREGCC